MDPNNWPGSYLAIHPSICLSLFRFLFDAQDLWTKPVSDHIDAGNKVGKSFVS
jgi:hypothetical protein